MQKTHHRLGTLVVCCLLAFGIDDANAQEVFSIDGTSTSPFAPGDILVPGPATAIPDAGIAAAMSLAGAEIDGLSDGTDFGTNLLFSVDRTSMGLPGTDVSLEAMGTGLMGPGDHPTDIYRNPLMGVGMNFIFRDGDGIANPLSAPSPTLGLMEPLTAMVMDNTDAYDLGPIGSPVYAGPIYFTVGAAMPAGLMIDTVYFVSPAGGSAPMAYAAGPVLTLGPTDDIDAIFVLDTSTAGAPDMIFSAAGDFIGFSLARGAPSLAAGSALSLLFAAGAPLSPADVFITTGVGGTFYVPAGAHGLLPNDNIDALEQTQIPEPHTIVLAGLALICLASRSRTQRK